MDDREAVCVVGPNGGGKTTLVKLILGLLTPQRGEIRVFGQPPRRARLRVGYMPQHVQHDPQFPVTVMDIVLMGRLGQADSRAACCRQADWAGTARSRPTAAAGDRRRRCEQGRHGAISGGGRSPRSPAGSGSGC